MMGPTILFDNVFASGTVHTTDMAHWGDVAWGEYPWGGQAIAPNLFDGKTYSMWQAMGRETQYIRIHCGVTREADCIGIYGHNLATCNVTVSVECSDDGFATVREACAPFVPTGNRAILKKFTRDRAKSWRIRISPSSHPVSIAVLMLGIALDLPYPPDTPYTPVSVGVESTIGKSKTGHFLGATIAYKPAEISIQISYVERLWGLTGYAQVPWGNIPYGSGGNLVALWNYLSTLQPFFYAWDYNTYPSEVYLVRGVPESKYETPMSLLPYVDRFSMRLHTIWEG